MKKNFEKVENLQYPPSQQTAYSANFILVLMFQYKCSRIPNCYNFMLPNKEIIHYFLPYIMGNEYAGLLP
jgi:hypothetical protein